MFTFSDLQVISKSAVARKTAERVSTGGKDTRHPASKGEVRRVQKMIERSSKSNYAI